MSSLPRVDTQKYFSVPAWLMSLHPLNFRCIMGLRLRTVRDCVRYGEIDSPKTTHMLQFNLFHFSYFIRFNRFISCFTTIVERVCPDYEISSAGRAKLITIITEVSDIHPRPTTLVQSGRLLLKWLGPRWNPLSLCLNFVYIQTLN